MAAKANKQEQTQHEYKVSHILLRIFFKKHHLEHRHFVYYIVSGPPVMKQASIITFASKIRKKNNTVPQTAEN